MIRTCAVVVVTLPLAAALAAPGALAQSYPREPYYSSVPPGPPPPGYRLDPNDPDVAIRRPQRQAQQPSRGFPYPEESNAAPPPPNFAPSNAPGYGHQLGAQQNGEPALRPPAAVGAAPGAPPQQAAPQGNSSVMQLPPDDQPEQGQPKELPANLKRQIVEFRTREPAGTIIIDTPHTYLYLILGGGKAMRYGIGVGREGFTWSGTERISRMKEWPDWFPPAEMIERQPYLPRMMAGGPGNPLGARALYLGHTLYRIHGTNQPSTIGSFVSSGCIRLLNEDIEDLYSRVQVGSRVVVLPGTMPATAAATAAINSPGAHPAATGAANVSPPTINGLTGKPMGPVH
jgi:lipoprotein-anchoring transpeptidase ErfK/SrfK